MTERIYGDDKTIHRTKVVDVEVNKDGKVVAVWFRCQPLPFKQSLADTGRANDMIAMYESGGPLALKAVVLESDDEVEGKV